MKITTKPKLVKFNIGYLDLKDKFAYGVIDNPNLTTKSSFNSCIDAVVRMEFGDGNRPIWSVQNFGPEIYCLLVQRAINISIYCFTSADREVTPEETQEILEYYQLP
jgi:hypothetical protein